MMGRKTKWYEASDEEEHQVTLSSYSINKYEVTQEEWEAVITDTQIRKEDESHTRYTLTLKLNKDITKDMLHNLLAQNEEILSVKMSRDT